MGRFLHFDICCCRRGGREFFTGKPLECLVNVFLASQKTVQMHCCFFVFVVDFTYVVNLDAHFDLRCLGQNSWIFIDIIVFLCMVVLVIKG